MTYLKCLACVGLLLSGHAMLHGAQHQGVDVDRASDDERVPRERAQFNRLLATNPNYFGNLKGSGFEPVQPIISNTTYEKITCLGFNPALDLLEATVQIKQPLGYGGDLCKSGSTEYIRFYVDYGDGWVDAGLASFKAHDIPNRKDCAEEPEKPLSYAVTLPLDSRRKSCRSPMLPMVRAILSWQLVPPADEPDWPPIWGNVVEERIQIKPRKLWFGDILDLLPIDKIKGLPFAINDIKPLPIPLPDPAPLSLGELVTLYSAKKSNRHAVEPHRFGLGQIQAAMKGGNQSHLVQAASEWKAVGLDFAAAVSALANTKANVSYEELDCLGLDNRLDRLVATFQIKQPLGYSGGLCTSGSKEYIAFWADWENSCEWTYLGTAAVVVHDIPDVGDEGLVYSAILPVDLNNVRRGCKRPKIARVRAVLSWNTLPSTVDPNDLNTWGNRIDSHVQIRPGEPTTQETPVVSIIGGIGVAEIDVFGTGMTKPGAEFAASGAPADPWAVRDCPFGGGILIQGPPMPGAGKYRVWARRAGDSSTEQLVKNPFHVVNWLGVGSTIYPNHADGYAPYLDTNSNINQTLAYFDSSSLGDDLWEIRLEAATVGTIVGSTPWYRVQLDNSPPRRKPPFSPAEPPEVGCEIHIDSGGDCQDFQEGSPITGSFVARDKHFGAFSLSTQPASTSPNQPTTLLASTSQSASFGSGGTAWELETAGMQPCGYVVSLHVSDRSIVNSQPGVHNRESYDTGLCLRQ